MLENSLEQMCSSALEMYTSAKPVELSKGSMSSPIGGSRPMRCHSGTLLGDSLPNAFGMPPKPSGFNLLKDNKENAYGIRRCLDMEDAKKELMEIFRIPEEDKTHGLHINYEITMPLIKKPLSNTHIPLDYLEDR